jgi:hypothetical protein
LLAHLGMALLLVQSTERVIQFCMTWVLPPGGVNTLDALDREKGRKRTLGQFLIELRKRVDLDDQFDSVLNEFLDKRNVLAHRLDTVWSLENDEGIETARRFIKRFLSVDAAVRKVFLALMHAWQAQIGSNVQPPTSVFTESDKFYLSLANSMFFEKEPPQSN